MKRHFAVALIAGALLGLSAYRSMSVVLSRTLSIQRLLTVGGKAPAAGCSTSQAGSEARVNYGADYLFYKAR